MLLIFKSIFFIFLLNFILLLFGKYENLIEYLLHELFFVFNIPSFVIQILIILKIFHTSASISSSHDYVFTFVQFYYQYIEC